MWASHKTPLTNDINDLVFIEKFSPSFLQKFCQFFCEQEEYKDWAREKNYGKVAWQRAISRIESRLSPPHCIFQTAAIPSTRLGSDKKFAFNDIPKLNSKKQLVRSQVESSPLFILYNLIYYPSSRKHRVASEMDGNPPSSSERKRKLCAIVGNNFQSNEFVIIFFLLREITRCRRDESLKLEGNRH